MAFDAPYNPKSDYNKLIIKCVLLNVFYYKEIFICFICSEESPVSVLSNSSSVT